MLKKYTNDILLAFHNNNSISPHAMHHIESYNQFIKETLPEIIKNGSREDTVGNKRAIIKFTDTHVMMPRLSIDKNVPVFPNECRLYNTNYLNEVFADYIFEVYDGATQVHHSQGRVLIGQILAMVMSDTCNISKLTAIEKKKLTESEDELGGYFITTGKEYVVISQENKILNNMYRNIDNVNGVPVYYVWIQSHHRKAIEMPIYLNVKLTKINLSKSDNESENDEIIYCAISSSKTQGIFFPVTILFKALGFGTDSDIINLIVPDNEPATRNVLKKTLLYRKDLPKTKREALLYISNKIHFDFRKKATYGKQSSVISDDEKVRNTELELIEKQLFPHLGGSENLFIKIRLLSIMVRKVIGMKTGIEKPHEISDYGNKRIQTSGYIYGDLVKTIFYSKIMDDYKRKIRIALTEFNEKAGFENYPSRFIDGTELIKTATNINTGTFKAGSAKGFRVKKGITSQLGRKNRLDTIDNLLRINAPTGSKNIKTVNMDLRNVSPYQYGFIDPCNSPEGEKIGLVKHKTYMSYITNYSSPMPIVDALANYQGVIAIEKTLPISIVTMATIFINGVPKFCIAESLLGKLLAHLVELKRQNKIPIYTSLIPDYYTTPFELLIWTDEHRFMRPLFIVENGKLRITKEILEQIHAGKFTWSDMLHGKNDVPPLVEYLEVSEIAKRCVIAFDDVQLNPSEVPNVYNYCEIFKGSIYGVNVMCQPFANHNQGPRITFQCNMGKASIGSSVSNHEFRSDALSLQLLYPQRSIVCPVGNLVTDLHKFPVTTNISIGVISTNGYEIEDAVVLAKHAVDAGFGFVIEHIVKKDDCESSKERYMRPTPINTKGYHTEYNYEKLSNDGMPIIGQKFTKADILIGKVVSIDKTELEKGGKYEYIDKSVRYTESLPGVVEKVIILPANQEYRTVKIFIRCIKKVSLGDKFAPRHAQKGVCGCLYKMHEMPFLEDGSVPTILFNGIGTIKRMTISHFIEMLYGLIGAQKGAIIDGTMFSSPKINEDIFPELEKLGFVDQGLRTMFDPKTGKPLKVKIFVGFNSYQRLKHISSDTLYARGDDGNYDPRTKQASKGKKEEGGSRIGYMEVDVLTAHGANSILNDMFSITADGRPFYISERTKMLCAGNEDNGYFSDSIDEKVTDVSKINSTWATSTFYNYLVACGIGTQIWTQ